MALNSDICIIRGVACQFVNINMSSRTTKTAQKAAASGDINMDKEAATSPQLNQGFLEGTSSPTMASMSEILQKGYLNEAFSDNLSTDEKLSLIISELYKMSKMIESVDTKQKTMQKTLENHNQIFVKYPDEDGEGPPKSQYDETCDQVKDNEDSIIGLQNAHRELSGKISDLQSSTAVVLRDVNLLKGISERHDKSHSAMTNKITNLTARSMDHNFTITGIEEGGQNENGIMKVMDMLRSKMGIQVEQSELVLAHRIGAPRPGITRAMVVKVTTALKFRILANKNKLKDKTNRFGEFFFVNQQLPEAIMAQKRAVQYEIKHIKNFNEGKPKAQKKTFAVKNKQLFVNDELYEQQVTAPSPLDLFVGPAEQKLLDRIQFSVSEPKSHESSQFIGLATKVHALGDVAMAYKKAKQLYPSYDHVMMAYKIDHHSGYQDDGEYNSGIKIHAKLLENGGHNMAVFVARNFGGVHIGQARFDCINEVAQKAINELKKKHGNDVTIPVVATRPDIQPDVNHEEEIP